MPLITLTMITDMKDRLVEAYDPEAIYLFGSYAWGNPHEESDLDLLVVVKSSNDTHLSRAIVGRHALWDFDVSKDVLVYTSKEFDEWSQTPTALAYKIKRDGKVLYARG